MAFHPPRFFMGLLADDSEHDEEMQLLKNEEEEEVDPLLSSVGNIFSLSLICSLAS